MNKQVSVQYAYKKDGKGERHGDQAERMLATEGKKHITQPAMPPLPVQLFGSRPPSAPGLMLLDTDPRRLSAPNANSAASTFLNGRNGMNLQTASQTAPQPLQQRSTPQTQSLSGPPPAGLPPRPPPSQAGYGGPQNFLPPGFNIPQSAGFTATTPSPGLPPGFQAVPGMRT